MSNLIRRPDLEAQSVSYPEYLTDRIFPFTPAPKDAGKIYYQKYHADVSAQYGRNTATVAGINTTTVASSKATYDCKEVRGRVRMSYDQIPGFSTKEAADLYMGRLAKREFYNKLEGLTATALLDNETYTDATSDPIAALDRGVSLLRDKGIGRVALVVSNSTYVALKNTQTVIDRMRNTGVAIYDLEARDISTKQMAAILRTDEVLVGKDNVWTAGVTNKGRGALVILPDEYTEPVEQVQLGRTIYFEFDGLDSKFVMESFHGDIDDAEYIDAKGLVDQIVLNPELMATYQLVSATAEDSSSEAEESTSEASASN